MEKLTDKQIAETIKSSEELHRSVDKFIKSMLEN